MSAHTSSGQLRLKIAATTAHSPTHTRAAFGDGQALSALASLHYNCAVEGAGIAIISLSKASEYARLAAIRTDERKDWISLIFLLEQQAQALRFEDLNDLADTAQAEAVAIAEHMGECGDEEIGRLLATAGESLSPKVLEMSGKWYRAFQVTRSKVPPRDLSTLLSLLARGCIRDRRA
jgi:hypothetical protein